MRRFNYREPRLSVSLPVVLRMGDSILEGFCNELSSEGMRVAVDVPFSPGSFGSVSLNFESLSVMVPVAVVRSHANGSALRFVYESKEQRDAVAAIVAGLGRPRPCTSLVLRRKDAESNLPAVISSNLVLS
jgi:hypothetical protein